MDPTAVKKRWKLAIWSIVAGMSFALLLWVVIPLARLARHLGVFEKHDMRTYNASNEANLAALYAAFMNYHETEGKFPSSAKWMDDVKTRIRANDMKPEEAMKKFVNPLLPVKKGAYGYAMNDAASEKYKGDIKDPKTPLIFDTNDVSWNAHGDPKKMLDAKAGNLAIAVDGSLVKLQSK